jgi:ribosome maturation factor RimP
LQLSLADSIGFVKRKNILVPMLARRTTGCLLHGHRWRIGGLVPAWLMVCRLRGPAARRQTAFPAKTTNRRRQILSQTDLDARLSSIIAPVVAAMGLELVRIQLSGQPGALTLQVMAEDKATGQLTLDQCAALSRALDLPLEESDPIPSEYALEVSSPGIDRPLTRAIDWQNWIGHEARMKLEPMVDGRARAHGDITALDGDDVLITGKTGQQLRLPMANIRAAKLVLTDRLIAATRPLDTTGADEIIESGAAADNDNETPDHDLSED